MTLKDDKNIVKAASGILIKNKKILLIQRSGNEKIFPLYWSLPGGKKEKNESLSKTAIREVKEEIGLDFTPDKNCFKKYVYETDNFKVFGYPFLGEFSGKINMNKDELNDYDWFSYKQLKKLKFAFKTKEIIEDLYKKKMI